MDSNISDQMKMGCAQRGDARMVPERWRTDERLGSLTPAAMMELAHGQGTGGALELLAGLVRLAAADELAARTVVQVVLPGVQACPAHSVSLGSSEDHDASVIEGLWRRVRLAVVAAPGDGGRQPQRRHLDGAHPGPGQGASDAEQVP